jgi:hypothetical protein
MTQAQKSKIADIVEDSIDKMLYDVLDSVGAMTGDESPEFKLKYHKLIDQLIELSIEHANNNL